MSCILQAPISTCSSSVVRCRPTGIEHANQCQCSIHRGLYINGMVQFPLHLHLLSSASWAPGTKGSIAQPSAVWDWPFPVHCNYRSTDDEPTKAPAANIQRKTTKLQS